MKKPKELVAINSMEIGGEKCNSVNARELYKFFESKQDFSHWIKNRIEKYGFVENEDYGVFDKFVENPQGGRPEIEYILALDMAKELGMLEANDKGKQIRKYFIEIEKYALVLVEEKMNKLEAKFSNEWNDLKARAMELLNKADDKADEGVQLLFNVMYVAKLNQEVLRTVMDGMEVIIPEDSSRALFKVLKEKQLQNFEDISTCVSEVMERKRDHAFYKSVFEKCSTKQTKENKQ